MHFQDSSRVKEKNLYDDERFSSFEVQTTPLSDGVLPGIIRQLVIELVLSFYGILDLLLSVSTYFMDIIHC